MSDNAYAPDKILAHPETLKVLREGGHPYPLHLHLILSDLCNLDCPGCAYRMSGYPSSELFIDPKAAIPRNPNRMLETALVELVLRDCAAMGTRAVEMTGGGEPTVHPDCAHLLDYAQNLGLDTALITNGILLPKIGAPAVRTQWLRISLDAATPETYARVRPGFGSANHFERACKGVRWAVEERWSENEIGATDCTIGVGFVVQEENCREIVAATALAYALGADNIRISGLFTPRGDEYHAPFRREAQRRAEEAVAQFDGAPIDGRPPFRVFNRYGEKLSDLSAPPDYSRCSYQRVTTYLGADANLYRCCVTSYSKHGLLGNIRDAAGLKALWDHASTRAELDCFDARSCERCQHNDKNRVINQAITPITHPYFV
jgi:MoaA/NifB/PqqE/SkfB family radical SAM enzyme